MSEQGIRIQDPSNFDDMILKKRKKNAFLGSLFKYLRKRTPAVSDLALLSHIVNLLRDNQMPFSKNEVYSAFRRVAKDNYANSDRRAIIMQLYAGAVDKVFEGKVRDTSGKK